MSNILKAFINTINSYQTNVSTLTNGNNRANNMGDGLEEFIKDIFAGTINETNEQNRLTTFSQTYSYSGNKNKKTKKNKGSSASNKAQISWLTSKMISSILRVA